MLKQKYIKKVKREYKPKWCSTKFRTNNKINGKYQYRFDFLVIFDNGKELIIELDGRQHYEQVSNWNNPFLIQIRDKYKEFKASKNNIPLIRCFQEDVYSDKNKWKTKLKKQLKRYSD